jgi:hypothetical protein
MDSFLICGFPRSRTLWLSHFLTVPSICICTHEATEHADSAEEFWRNADHFSYGHEFYGNSDSANNLVLPSLLAERPLAKVVWIERPIAEVRESLLRAKIPFAEGWDKVLPEIRDRHVEYFDLIMDWRDLSTMHGCRKIWEFCLPGVPFDYGRWGTYNARKICYSAENPYPEKSYEKLLVWLRNESYRVYPVKEA